MKKYLLDTNILGAYLRGRPGAARLAQTWIFAGEATTSVLVYGEIIEYFKSFPDYPHHQAALRMLLRKVYPYALTCAQLECYADLRRAMRPPRGPGIIGDVDTLIAATALQHDLTLVTTDGDFQRVPELRLLQVPIDTLR
jgi:predicted nucleic acid-binding protein